MPNRSLLSSALRLVLVALISFLLVEATVRIYFAWSLGPRVLLYGTQWYRAQFAVPLSEASAQRHGQIFGQYTLYKTRTPTGYAKYFPNEVKYTDSPDHREQYRIQINNQGFRGNDFTVAKAPGVKRILTMGASSTFGYHNRDDETYPHYLEKMLNADGRGRFEVINFAIPHATSGNIAAMLTAEGLALEPDFVTFYEGVNDAGIFEVEDTRSARLLRVLADHLLIVQLADPLFKPFGSLRDGWTEEFAARRSNEFLANLEIIAAECKDRNIRFIVATQQAKSDLVPQEAMRGLTYAQEVELVEAKMAAGEVGPEEEGFGPRNKIMEAIAHLNPARVLFVHSRLMRNLREWARTHNVELVDVQKVLDQRRDLILTWVHLHPEANKMVAAALARQILADSFPDAPANTAAPAALGESRPES